jgi:hypothetical protein
MKGSFLRAELWRHQASSEHDCSLTRWLQRPMAKPRLEENPTTGRIRYRSRLSSSRRTLDQLPNDNENPTQVDSLSIIPITTLVATAPTTPRRDRPAPSTSKRTPGPQTRSESTPGYNGEGDAEDEIVLPLVYRPVFLDHRQWYTRAGDCNGAGATQVAYGEVWTIYN